MAYGRFNRNSYRSGGIWDLIARQPAKSRYDRKRKKTSQYNYKLKRWVKSNEKEFNPW